MSRSPAIIEREAFSERLTATLSNNGYTKSPTDFAREFNLRSQVSKITVHGARKWLVGEAFPTHERLQTLANWLSVSPEWLRFGTDSSAPKTNSIQSNLLPKHEAFLLRDFRLLARNQQRIVVDLIHSLLRNVPQP